MFLERNGKAGYIFPPKFNAWELKKYLIPSMKYPRFCVVLFLIRIVSFCTHWNKRKRIILIQITVVFHKIYRTENALCGTAIIHSNVTHAIEKTLLRGSRAGQLQTADETQLHVYHFWICFPCFERLLIYLPNSHLTCSKYLTLPSEIFFWCLN